MQNVDVNLWLAEAAHLNETPVTLSGVGGIRGRLHPETGTTTALLRALDTKAILMQTRPSPVETADGTVMKQNTPLDGLTETRIDQTEIRTVQIETRLVGEKIRHLLLL